MMQRYWKYIDGITLLGICYANLYYNNLIISVINAIIYGISYLILTYVVHTKGAK